MMCLISSRADLTLKSQCVMSSVPAEEFEPSSMHCSRPFATLIVFSRYPSMASCVVTATGCSDSVVFLEVLLGTCCSVSLVCASLTSRGSLFVVILLLLCEGLFVKFPSFESCQFFLVLGPIFAVLIKFWRGRPSIVPYKLL